MERQFKRNTCYAPQSPPQTRPHPHHKPPQNLLPSSIRETLTMPPTIQPKPVPVSPKILPSSSRNHAQNMPPAPIGIHAGQDQLREANLRQLGSNMGSQPPPKWVPMCQTINVEKSIVFGVVFVDVWPSFWKGFWNAFCIQNVCHQQTRDLCEKLTKHCVGAQNFKFSLCN